MRAGDMPRIWLMRLAQMPLANTAPHDCLQYYTNDNGKFIVSCELYLSVRSQVLLAEGIVDVIEGSGEATAYWKTQRWKASHKKKRGSAGRIGPVVVVTLEGLCPAEADFRLKSWTVENESQTIVVAKFILRWSWCVMVDITNRHAESSITAWKVAPFLSISCVTHFDILISIVYKLREK